MSRPARVALHGGAIVALGVVGYFLGTSGRWGFAGFVVIMGAVIVLAVVGASRRAKDEGPEQT